MKKIQNIMKYEFVQNIAVILIVTLAYLLVRALGIADNVRIIQSIMLIGLGVCVAIGIFYRKQLDEKAIMLLIVMGMIMRIGYALYTGCTTRPHDLGDIQINSKGHAGYVLWLIQKHELPDTSWGQMYQQPLFYLLASVYSSVVNGLLGESKEFFLVDAAKNISCIASCISLLLCHRIAKEVDLDKKGMRVALTLVAFLPTFYITGATVNPDALAYMFMLYALLYVLRWIKEESWKNTMILAIIFGCGVMTKVSCGVVALVTAGIFLWKLIAAVRQKKAGMLCLKYIVFGCISLPLGLWYSVRNYRLFGQALTYVPRLADEHELYTGDYSIAGRLFGIDFANLFRGPYTDVYQDYNAPVYYLKSALFGEFKFKIQGWIPTLILMFATILAVYAIISVIWHFKKNRKNTFGTVLAIYAIVFYISTLWFYLRFPHGCSMDFRYMPFLVIPLAILLGNYSSQAKRRGRFLEISLCGFGIMSCMMYCLIPH